MGEYQGETDAKRLARLHTARRIMELWDSMPERPAGCAITLAGPSAGDVGVMKHVLEFVPDMVVAVDEQAGCAERFAQSWPNTNAVHGNLLDVVRDLKFPIAYANLDFCGILSEQCEEAIRIVGDKLAIGGIVTYTFFRGREGKMPLWDEIVRIPSTREGRDKTDEQRLVYYARRMSYLLGGAAEPVYLLRYQAERSPMTILGYQYMPLQHRTKDWRRALENSAVHGGTLETASSLRERLKFAAVGLLNRGMTPNQVAEVLNLPKSTVVAWLAHETRGSYMGKPVRQQEGPR